jgi:hypothetical protein
MEFPFPKSNFYFIWKITSNEQLKYNYSLLKSYFKIFFSITTICELFESVDLLFMFENHIISNMCILHVMYK